MANTIPIINLERISFEKRKGKNTDWEEIADEIRKALHEVGFMYLINHGIPNDIVSLLALVCDCM